MIKWSYMSGEEVSNQNESIAVRSKVSVVWGKWKKTYNAYVEGNGSVAEVQQAISHKDEPFAVEVVNPASTDTQGPPSHEERQPTLTSRMEQLADVVASLEARILCHLDSIKYGLVRGGMNGHWGS